MGSTPVVGDRYPDRSGWVVAGAGDVVLGGNERHAARLPVFGHTLPLNPDVYDDFTVAQPNTLIHQPVGALNAGGRASAYFILPRGWPPQLAGLRLHHAALVFRLAPFLMTTMIHAASLLLVR
jgi:hypothetical protein